MNEPLWGVGCYHDGEQRVAWEISNAEIQRDMTSAAKVLGELGIGARSRVLFCSLLAEAGQFWPFIVASMLAGAQFSLADETRADALRVRVLLRHLEFDAVIGVGSELLAGLHDLGADPTGVFASVPIVAARPGAYEHLLDGGLAPHRFALIGPAVAIGPGPGRPARVDPDEWVVAARSERAWEITNLLPRATAFERRTIEIPHGWHDGVEEGAWPSAR